MKYEADITIKNPGVRMSRLAGTVSDDRPDAFAFGLAKFIESYASTHPKSIIRIEIRT